MGKIKGFMLNRKQYNRIRKMDHCQMTLWAESVYKSGYTDGKEAASGLTAPEIREVLLQVKGIGEKSGFHHRRPGRSYGAEVTEALQKFY